MGKLSEHCERNISAFTARSAMRALFSSYEGPLARWRLPDGTEFDSYAEFEVQPGTKLLRMYDQSGNGNDLVSPPGREPTWR